MNDSEFIEAFHNGSLPNNEFRHKGRLRLAWLVLERHGLIEANGIISREIRRFAASQGDAGMYHKTLTRFWVHLVAHAKGNGVRAKSIDELLERFPFLLDKSLPYKHWTSESFNSQSARTGWIPPDILPLP